MSRSPIPVATIENTSVRQEVADRRTSRLLQQAGELAGLTASQVLVVVVGEDGQTHSFATPHMQHFFDNPTTQQTLRECLTQTPRTTAATINPPSTRPSPLGFDCLASSLNDLSLSAP